ncbi:TIGR03086 family protein, partial [Mycobacterium terramassiliense]
VDPLVAHQRAQEAFAAVLARVGPDQLGAPTPCTLWTIGDLIDHVIGGNERVGLWAANPTQPAARPDDAVAAHRASAQAAQDVFAGPDGMTAMYKLPFGDVPGQVFVGMRTSDVLTHAWDLAFATNQSTDLDPELAAQQLTVARAFVRNEFRGPGRPFGHEQSCSPERAPADQLAAFLGRKVQ